MFIINKEEFQKFNIDPDSENYCFSDYNQFLESLTELANLLKIPSFKKLCEQFELELCVIPYQLPESDFSLEMIRGGFSNEGNVVFYNNDLLLKMVDFSRKNLTYSSYINFKESYQVNRVFMQQTIQFN